MKNNTPSFANSESEERVFRNREASKLGVLMTSLTSIDDYKNKVEEILQFGPVNWEKLEELKYCYKKINFQEWVKEVIKYKWNNKPNEQEFNLAQAEERNLTSSRMRKMSRR